LVGEGRQGDRFRLGGGSVEHERPGRGADTGHEHGDELQTVGESAFVGDQAPWAVGIFKGEGERRVVGAGSRDEQR
jgi:hypothetical protein